MKERFVIKGYNGDWYYLIREMGHDPYEPIDIDRATRFHSYDEARKEVNRFGKRYSLYQIKKILVP